MNTDITDFLPRPEVIRISGREYKVRQHVLNDVTDLQMWLRANSLTPGQIVRPMMEGLPDADRKYLHARAYSDTLAGNWYPKFGTPQASERLTTTREGRAELLRVGLRRDHPEITIDEADRLVRELPDQEWLRFLAIFFGVRPEDEAAREVFGESSDPKAVKPPTSSPPS